VAKSQIPPDSGDPLAADPLPAPKAAKPAPVAAAAASASAVGDTLAALYQPFGVFGQQIRTEAEAAYHDFVAALPNLQLDAEDQDSIRWATHQLATAAFAQIGAKPEAVKVLNQQVLDAKSVLADVAAIKVHDGEQLVGIMVRRIFARGQDFLLAAISHAAVAVVAAIA
jgi:hypothetical protein